MKKIITIILLATIVTSCKKDWNCKCTFSATGEVDVIRKKDAKQICETTFQSSDATCALQ
jgi:hypothetical protein